MCPDYFGTGNVSRPFYGCGNANNYCAAIVPNMPAYPSSVYDPMSMDCSLYGGGFDLASDYTSGIGNYGVYGCGGGYGVGGYGFNPESMYQQMDKWTDYMYDRNVKYTEKARANDMRINGPMNSLQYAADALKEKIEKDDQPQIKEAFEKYKQTLKTIYPQLQNLSDKDLTTKAMELYKERNNIGLKDDIRQNSMGMFGQKFLHAATLGFANNGSAEETISDITGAPVSKADKLWGAVGTAAGIATTGTIAISAGNQILKHPTAVAKFCGRNWLGLAIAAVATAIGLASYKS